MPTVEEFWQKVDTFKRKVAEFFALFGRLQEARPLVEAAGDPELEARYQRQLERGGYIDATIRTVQETIDAAKAKLEQAADVFDGHLGIAPVVLLGAVALISGAIAAVTGWIADSYELFKALEAEASRQETYDALRAQGLTHNQALAVIEAAKPPAPPAGLLDKAGMLLGLAIAGALIWWASSSSSGRRA